MKAVSMAVLVAAAGTFPLGAQDPGKEVIGKVRTELIFGTNGSVASLGGGVTALSKEETDRLKKSQMIGEKIGRFSNFVKLGSVEQPVLRGYKSWAAPLADSKAIMLTFQPQARVAQEKKLRLDIEFWQKEKMVWRWDPVVEVGNRIYLAGPKWRGGHLIITVELVSLK